MASATAYQWTRGRSDTYAWRLLPILLLGLGLGLHELTADSLWFDETLTGWAARSADLTGVLDYLDRWSDVRPLYFFLMHFTTRVGESEFWLRLPSVGFGLLGLVLTYQVGRRLFGPREGVWAAFLLASSALFVHYMQEARTYSLFVCLSLLSLYCFERAWRRGRWRWWAAFAVASVLNAYTHHFSAFVLASELAVGGILLLRDQIALRGVPWRERFSLDARPGRRLIGLLISLAVIGLALLPSVPALIDFVRVKGGGETLARGLEWSLPFWVDVANQFSVGERAGAQLQPLAWILLVLCLAGLLAGGWRRQRRALLWLAAWTVVPFLVLFLLPSRHFFHIRYVLYVLPLLLLGAAWGITAVVDVVRSAPVLRQHRAVGPLLAALLAVGFLAASSAPLRAWYAAPRQPWRELAAFFGEQMLPGEVLLIEPAWYVAALAYYGEDSVQGLDGSLAQFREFADPAAGVWYLRTAQAVVDPEGEIRSYIDAEGYTELLRSERIDNRLSLYYKRQDTSQPRPMLPILQAVVQIDPGDAEVHGLLAEEYRTLAQFAAARLEYERAWELDPASPMWLVFLGRAYVEEGAPEHGLDLARQGVGLAPQNAWLRIVLGDLLAASDQPAAALAEYERAREIDPNYEGRAWFHLRLGQAYYLQGRTDEALSAFERALDLDAGNSAAAQWLQRLRK